MSKVGRYTRMVKKHDRDLFAVDAGACLQIHRRADSVHQTFCAAPMTQYIISLTDNWKPDGDPAEWGEIPLLEMLKSMDRWNNELDIDEMRNTREQQNQNRKTSARNEMKARAYDLRKEFARATNDINTSTLEKEDKRRSKNGNC